MDNHPKRVLLVATVQSHIGQFHKPLMRMLKENGWEIHVAARNNLAEKDTLTLDYPDIIYDLPFQRSPFDLRNLRAYQQLKAILKQTHYDVIHCNTPVGGILTRMAARKYRKTGTEVFYTAHGFHFYKGAPRINWLVYYPIEKHFAGYTDKLITVNQEDYELAKKHFFCEVYHIHGVGANSEKYIILDKKDKQRLRSELGLSGHILISVGELLPNKNQKTAIKSLKTVLQSYPDTYLLIAGNGPEKDRLEELAASEKLSDHVCFLGYTLRLQRYLQAADAEIACSYREGLPLNILEAMLCGIPVIASNNRGHREVIQDGVNGYIVSANDTKAYADAICKLFSKEKIKASDIKESVEQYTDQNVLQELRAIYLEAKQL